MLSKFNFLMNKIYLFTAAFAVMASLSGCSDTELASIDTAQEKTPIGFHTVGSQMGSRANIINSADITKTDFNVFAFEKNADGADGAMFMGGDKTNSVGLAGVNISYSEEDKWHYTTGSDLKYWPTTPLNFYAVNPAKIADLTFSYAWEIEANKKQITYHCFDEKNGKSNVDVMYAIAKNQEKSTNSGTVSLKFHHILSQVAFRAKTNSDGMQVDIKEIKIKNFKTGGIFNFPDDAETKPTQSNWQLGDTYTHSAFTLISKADDAPIVVNSTSTAKDITIANPMLFAPQTLPVWNTSHNIAAADNSGESYLIISCKIKIGNFYKLGSATKYETLYIPFGGYDWEPGMRYVYTLVFGGGYDENGNPILQPINFVPSVEEWVGDGGNSTTGNDIPLYQ